MTKRTHKAVTDAVGSTWPSPAAGSAGSAGSAASLISKNGADELASEDTDGLSESSGLPATPPLPAGSSMGAVSARTDSNDMGEI